MARSNRRKFLKQAPVMAAAAAAAAPAVVRAEPQASDQPVKLAKVVHWSGGEGHSYSLLL